MTSDVQLSESAADLFDVASKVTADWLRRCVVAAIRRSAPGRDPHGIVPDAEIDRMARESSRQVLHELRALLVTDVDEQRTNPLSIYRDAVAGPTELLRSHGVAPPTPDPFVAEHFPGDAYALGPATWADIDPALQQPGIVWSAWKAMTVLQRRRADGVR